MEKYNPEQEEALEESFLNAKEEKQVRVILWIAGALTFVNFLSAILVCIAQS